MKKTVNENSMKKMSVRINNPFHGRSNREQIGNMNYQTRSLKIHHFALSDHHHGIEIRSAGGQKMPKIGTIINKTSRPDQKDTPCSTKKQLKYQNNARMNK